MKRKSILALVALVMIVITATMLVGCSGQKIKAEDYSKIIEFSNLSKIEDFKYSTIKVENGLTTIHSYAVDAENETAKYTVKEPDKNDNKKVVTTEYIIDLKENKIYQYDSSDKKYALVGTLPSIDKDIALLAVSVKLHEISFDSYKKIKGIYTYQNADKNLTVRASFKSDQLAWMTRFEGTNNDNQQIVFEAGDQKIKLPKDKQIKA